MTCIGAEPTGILPVARTISWRTDSLGDWKLASLGVPVVLVYLGFLNAVEMNDRGRAIESSDAWESAVRAHARGIVPEDAWGHQLDVDGTAMVLLIRSMELPLTGGTPHSEAKDHGRE